MHAPRTPPLLAVAVALIVTIAASPVALSSKALAQQFVDAGAALPQVDHSAVEWGDYDGDGDLDLAIGGESTGGAVTRLLRNDGGSLVVTGVTLVQTSNGSLRWGDYDRDGDLDLVVTGVGGGPGDTTRIYRNDGSGTFVDIAAPLTGVFQSDAAWVDVDSDGDLDLSVVGSSLELGIDVNKLYLNEGDGTFVELPTALFGCRRGSIDWADYDLDGDPDVLLTGLMAGFTPRTELYRNDGDGAFTIVPAGLIDTYDGAARWGDFDADGDPDILLTGTDASFDVHTLVYRNDHGTFVELGQNLWGAGEGSSVAWGDTDGDGDLDFVATAVLFGGTSLFRNDAGSFVEGGSELRDVCCGSLAWGDYDGDQDLDLLLSGNPNVTKLYRNILSDPNAAPGPPQSLSAVVDGSVAELTWSAATDAETPATGLTYNIRVGRMAGGQDVVSPMALPSGRRLVATWGNVGTPRTWSLHDLGPGTYFWSVQAIDNEFAGSAFATEGSFTVGGTNAAPEIRESAAEARVGAIYPQPLRSESIARLEIQIPAPCDVRVDLFDPQGRFVGNLRSGSLAAGRHQLSWQPRDARGSALAAGVYYIRVATPSWTETRAALIVP